MEVMDELQSYWIYWGLSGQYSCRFRGRWIGYSLADEVENWAVAVIESVSHAVADADQIEWQVQGQIQWQVCRVSGR